MTSIRDIIVIVVLLLAVGLSLVLIANTGHIINAQLKTTSVFNSSAEAQQVFVKTDAAINMTDYMFIAAFIGFFLAIVVFGYLVGSNPIFAPIYFFILVFFAFVGVILQLVWMELASRPDVILSMTNFPMLNYLLSHLGYFTVVMGLAGLLAMFAKPPEGSPQ